MDEHLKQLCIFLIIFIVGAVVGGAVWEEFRPKPFFTSHSNEETGIEQRSITDVYFIVKGEEKAIIQCENNKPVIKNI